MISWLPHLNVGLNTLSLCLLIAGFVLIKRGHERAHRWAMLSALVVSVLFLISYLIYHANVPSKRFPTDPEVAPAAVRYFYYTMLLSHVVLAAVVPFLAIAAAYYGWRDQRVAHRRIVRWAWPIWVYVSATGIGVYLMLYRIYAAVLLALLAVGLWCGGDSRCYASDPLGGMPPVRRVSSAQQLRLEQAMELVNAGQLDEAISILETLYDEGLGQLVPTGGLQAAGTQRVQVYYPLRRWVPDRLREILAKDAEVRERYERRTRPLAEGAFRSIAATHNLQDALEAARRYAASQVGPDLHLTVADLCLERGWGLAAWQAIERAVPELRVTVTGEDGDATLPWPLVWRNYTMHDREGVGVGHSTEDVSLGRLEQAMRDPVRAKRVWAAIHRMVLAAIAQPQLLDREAVFDWARFVLQRFGESDEWNTLALIDESAQWPSSDPEGGWAEWAGNSQRTGTATGRFTLDEWPVWSQPLEAFTANSDKTPASKPRVGELSHGLLAFFPVTDGRRVFVNALHRIQAFSLDTGKPWPAGQRDGVLFDSRISSAAFLPLGYPLVGSPRGTLTLVGDTLYARMGNPVTGWANFESASDGGSIGYLVGLDLSREGMLLPGFPLRLLPPTFEHAEIEGAPVIVDDLAIVAVLERDNVGVRRGVAAFDRWTGKLRWYTGPLATGAVEGTERANLITNQLISYAGGRLYYNTNLGSIVCLDPLDGGVVWQTRYRRVLRQQHSYPTPDRFRYRSLTPCVVSHGLVFCAPQDAPEIFALDATGGALVWSTDEAQVADAIHLLGIAQDALVCAGDHVVWLNRGSGRVMGRFPGPNTPGNVHALPQPRGLGRGLIVDGRVLWPIAGEVLVLELDTGAVSVRTTPLVTESTGGKSVALIPMPKPVRILRRYVLGSRGAEGGNLIPAGNMLLYASPRRIMAFERVTDKNRLSLNP